jgi:tRNA pseudouridine38-40 synthase
MPTYRLDLAYDGAPFHGYAKQPNVRTVQGDLEKALAPYTGDAHTYVAGRTDKGVHASEQIVSFTCNTLDTGRVVRSLNRQLAPSIAARRLTKVDDDFHARFSATGRAYRYHINNAPVHDPLSAGVTWTVTEDLDVELMHTAIQAAVGEHDFAAYCRRFEERPTTRVVEWAAWRRTGTQVELSIGSPAFCHQLVRSLAAVSVDIGRDRLPPDALEVILASQDRSTSKGVAPPQGLTLVAVSYGDQPLPKPGWLPEIS